MLLKYLQQFHPVTKRVYKCKTPAAGDNGFFNNFNAVSNQVLSGRIHIQNLHGSMAGAARQSGFYTNMQLHVADI